MSKIFLRDVLKQAVECKYLSGVPEIQKMKEDYFNQLDDYDKPYCGQQYTLGSCLFVC